MLEKNLIGSENKNGKDKFYYPMITREEALKCESESLIGRISAASVGYLVALLANSEGLSEDDQRELLEFSEKLEKRSGREDNGNADSSR
jgi:BlaI family penicillinase repressor